VLSIPFTIHEASRLTVHNFIVRTADGEEFDLENYDGKVLLIVNVATGCGLTPQFLTLQTLYETYRDRDFVMLGFPSNAFGNEVRSNSEISLYCSDMFLVDFPIFAKVDLMGTRQDPLFKHLTSVADESGLTGPVRYNFEKFLVDGKGRLIRRFSPESPPDDPDLAAAIEHALNR